MPGDDTISHWIVEFDHAPGATDLAAIVGQRARHDSSRAIDADRHSERRYGRHRCTVADGPGVYGTGVDDRQRVDC